MKNNIGSADRVIRILAAIVFALMYFTGMVEGVLGIVLLVAGIVLGLTAVINFCPIYWSLGLTTGKK